MRRVDVKEDFAQIRASVEILHGATVELGAEIDAGQLNESSIESLSEMNTALRELSSSVHQLLERVLVAAQPGDVQ